MCTVPLCLRSGLKRNKEKKNKKIYLYKGCYCVKLLSKWGSWGGLCPQPPTARGWAGWSRAGVGCTATCSPPSPAASLARPGFHKSLFSELQRGAGTLQPRTPLPAPSTFPAGRIWHELHGSLPSLLLPEAPAAINSSGCLLINILIQGNILFSLKSINSLCLDFFIRLIFKANQALLLASGSHTSSTGCSASEAAPERALLAGQGFSGSSESDAFGVASPRARKLLIISDMTEDRDSERWSAASLAASYPGPCPSLPHVALPARVGGLGQRWTCVEETFSLLRVLN